MRAATAVSTWSWPTNRDGFWLRGLGADGDGRVALSPLAEGLGMLTAFDLDDEESSARTRLYRPRFVAAPAPDPATGDWSAWIALLAARDSLPDAGPGEAMTVITHTPFGTLSSSLIALPAAARPDARPLWLFCAGRPGENPHRPVDV